MNRIHDRWQRDGTGKVKRYGSIVLVGHRISDVAFIVCLLLKKELKKKKSQWIKISDCLRYHLQFRVRVVKIFIAFDMKSLNQMPRAPSAIVDCR